MLNNWSKYDYLKMVLSLWFVVLLYLLCKCGVLYLKLCFKCFFSIDVLSRKKKVLRINYSLFVYIICINDNGLFN